MTTKPLRRNALVAALMSGFAACAFAQFDSSSAGRAVSESAAAVNGEIAKGAMVDKTVAEGVESFRQTVGIQRKAAELEADLKQPMGLCQTMETQDELAKRAAQAKAKSYSAQRQALGQMSANTNTAVAIEQSAEVSNAKFCAPEDASRGACQLSTDSRYVNLAGADQDAMFLFQTRSGGDSYEGGRDGSQVEAVNGYIRRVVVGVPTEQLRQRGAAAYKNNPQARAYIEMQRRYQAFLSMSAYSLNQIKEARNPAK